MTSIADAYVELHVDGDNIAGEVKKSLKGASKSAEADADKSGQRIGSKMGGGFLKGFGRRRKGFFSIGKDLGETAALGILIGLDKVKDGGARLSKSFKGMADGLKGMNLRSLGMGALVAALPLLTSGASALSGALVALTGAVVQAGGASLSMVGIMGSLVQGMLVGKIAFKDFTKAVAGDEEALKKMSPAARAAAKAAGDLGGAWGKVRKAIQQNTFAGLDKVIERVGKTTLPGLRKELAGTGTALNSVFKQIGGFVTSKGFIDRFGVSLKNNNKIITILGKAAVPLLKGILNVFIALQPAAIRLAGKIRDVGKQFAAWSSAPGTAKGIREFMDRAWKSAGNLWKIIKNLGSTLRNVFGAATPAGDGLLKTFERLTARLAAFTELASTKNAIADWAQKGIEVSGTLFKGLGKGFMMIKGLFDPAILGGFMSVFAGLMPTITAVVKTIQGALKPVLDAVIGGFAKNGPKFAALFSALAPLLKGLGSVIGEVISQALDLLGTVAAVITPVVAAISDFIGPILTKFAPIIATVILALGPQGLAGGLVKLVPIIGRFMAPLVNLAGAILRVVGPAVKFLGQVIGVVFRGIAAVVVPTMKLVYRFVAGYFKIMFTVVRLYLKVMFSVVKFVWRGISKVIGTVIKVVWKIISTYFRLYFKVISTVLKAIRAVVTRVFNTIRSVISRVMEAVRNVISRVWNSIRAITSRVWNGIKSVVSKVVSGIWNTISKGFSRILNKIKGIPGKIAALATGFLNAGRDLGSAILDGIRQGISAIGDMAGSIAGTLKDGINNAIGLPKKMSFSVLGKDIGFTIPGFARGTNFAPGGLAVVGERGPEMVHLPRGSRVDTARETRAAVGKTVTQNVNVQQIVQGGRGTPLRELNWAMKYGTGIKKLQEAG